MLDAIAWLVVALVLWVVWWRAGKPPRLPELPPYEGPRILGPGHFYCAGREVKQREAR